MHHRSAGVNLLKRARTSTVSRVCSYHQQDGMLRLSSGARASLACHLDPLHLNALLTIPPLSPSPDGAKEAGD